MYALYIHINHKPVQTTEQSRVGGAHADSTPLQTCLSAKTFCSPISQVSTPRLVFGDDHRIISTVL